MAFIIYKLYLDQYWKASKFHSHWKPAGQAALPCRHLQILNLWTGDHGAWWGPSTWGRAVSKALPPQPHHLETCTILPFFQLAHLFRSKHRQGEKNLRSMVFSQFPPLFGHLLTLQWDISSQMPPNPSLPLFSRRPRNYFTCSGISSGIPSSTLTEMKNDFAREPLPGQPLK